MRSALPNVLTLSRIAVIPLLIGAFFLPGAWANWTAFALFAAAGITDWLDGHLARRWRVTSPLGRFLDPIADKLLVVTAIVLLIWADRMPLAPALIILCREVLVSGLREYLAELNVGLPVSHLAKYKTALQLIAIAVLLIGDAGPVLVAPELTTPAIGAVLVWAAAALTVVTGYGYLRTGFRHMVARPQSGKPEPGPTESGQADDAEPAL